mmetsp:Transcript_10514/g.32345  ORF Transcript_10514/g.32345 Transcript_10514/m.32345 type:complete len:211 (-) Transcript_10514:889-1521(-)
MLSWVCNLCNCTLHATSIMYGDYGDRYSLGVMFGNHGYRRILQCKAQRRPTTAPHLVQHYARKCQLTSFGEVFRGLDLVIALITFQSVHVAATHCVRHSVSLRAVALSLFFQGLLSEQQPHTLTSSIKDQAPQAHRQVRVARIANAEDVRSNLGESKKTPLTRLGQPLLPFRSSHRLCLLQPHPCLNNPADSARRPPTRILWGVSHRPAT